MVATGKIYVPVPVHYSKYRSPGSSTGGSACPGLLPLPGVLWLLPVVNREGPLVVHIPGRSLLQSRLGRCKILQDSAVC